jgi:hypothetical protein
MVRYFQKEGTVRLVCNCENKYKTGRKTANLNRKISSSNLRVIVNLRSKEKFEVRGFIQPIIYTARIA